MNNYRKNVCIIGAGYTGLVCAYRLAQKGHAVTILEGNSQVGGLASGFLIEGAPLERAYHHLFKTDTDIIKLVEQLGLGNALRWHDSSVAMYYDGHLYPFKGALDLIRFKPLALHNRVRAGLAVVYLQKTKNWQKLQHTTAYNWMRRYAGKQVTDVIWEPLLKGKFADYHDKVSMAWLWARIHIRAQSREASGEKLGYFEGGFQVLTDALVQKLNELEVTIETDVKVGSIANTENGSVRVTKADGSSKTYDRCVATVPSHVFAKLIAHDKKVEKTYLDKLNSIQYLGARLLIFSSSQDISPYYWHNINDVNLPFLVFINHTRLISKQHYGGMYVYYIATYVPHEHELFACDDQTLENLWFSSLVQIFPEFDPTKIHEKHFFRFANAQHIVDIDYVRKIPAAHTPLPNVYLSNFSQIYPEDRGTNYAVREGERIAQLLAFDN